jgi:hypothetical protein
MEKLNENLMTTAYFILVLLKDKKVAISSKSIMDSLDKIKNSDEANDLAKELTENCPELYDIIFKIINKNIVEEGESLIHWNNLAFDRN